MSTGRREAPRSELGRQVTVDLEADANLYEYWAIPGHASPPLSWPAGRITLRKHGHCGTMWNIAQQAGPRRENP
jgi:hypothetical protein